MESARSTHGEEVAPKPADLVESLRDFGYTLPSALADLVDNSLTAGAKEIDVCLEAAGRDSYVAVVDDGCGMDQETLVEAMRMGTKGPLATRSANDLGRFGLGMKTASLSQGTRLTVATKAPGTRTLVRRWDLAHIRTSGRWELLTDPTAIAAPSSRRSTRCVRDGRDCRRPRPRHFPQGAGRGRQTAFVTQHR